MNSDLKQIGLLLVILLLIPKSIPSTEKTHTITELHHEAAAGDGKASSTEATKAAVPQDGVRYAVVFDAGSTGSRVHIFKFEQSGGVKGLKLISDTFEQLKPGLSSFPDDPEGVDGALHCLRLPLGTSPCMRSLNHVLPSNLSSRGQVSSTAHR